MTLSVTEHVNRLVSASNGLMLLGEDKAPVDGRKQSLRDLSQRWTGGSDPFGAAYFGVVPAELGLVCLDVDYLVTGKGNDATKEHATRHDTRLLTNVLDELGVPYVVEPSTKGGHVWLPHESDLPQGAFTIHVSEHQRLVGDTRAGDGYIAIRDPAIVASALDLDADADPFANRADHWAASREPAQRIGDVLAALVDKRVPTGRNEKRGTVVLREPDRVVETYAALRFDGYDHRKAAATVKRAFDRSRVRVAALKDAGMDGLRADNPVSYSKLFNPAAKYDAAQSQWYLWTDGEGWHAVVDARVWDAITANNWRLYEADAIGDEELRRCDALQYRRDVAVNLTTRDDIAITPDTFDADPFVCGLPDGRLLDLRTNAVRDMRPEDMVSRRLAVAPDDSSPPERWLAFLDEALDGDADTVEWLRAWFRYCLSGDTSKHTMTFIYGPPGTGKSTVGELLHDMLGSYARVVDGEKLAAATPQAEHDAWMLPFVGSRFVYADELGGGAWRAGKVRQLVSGKRLSCRKMRGEPFDFTPYGKLHVSGNAHPRCERGDGLWRRLAVLPMTKAPQRADRNLPAALRAEMGAILSWTLGGAASVVETRTTAMVDAYADARDSADRLGAQCEELLERVDDVSGKARVDVAALCERLNADAVEGDFTWTVRKLIPKLKALGYTLGRSGNKPQIHGTAWREARDGSASSAVDANGLPF